MGTGPAPRRAPGRARGPRRRSGLGSWARAGGCGLGAAGSAGQGLSGPGGVGPPRWATDGVPGADCRRVGAGRRTDGTRRAASPPSHLLCSPPPPGPREESRCLVGCCPLPDPLLLPSLPEQKGRFGKVLGAGVCHLRDVLRRACVSGWGWAGRETVCARIFAGGRLDEGADSPRLRSPSCQPRHHPHLHPTNRKNEPLGLLRSLAPKSAAIL